MRDMWRGYDAWRTSTPWDNQPDHQDGCPAGEDAEPVYSECGGVGKCECKDSWNWIDKVVAWFYGVLDEECAIDTEPDCTCQSADEIAADRAEAWADARLDD